MSVETAGHDFCECEKNREPRAGETFNLHNGWQGLLENLIEETCIPPWEWQKQGVERRGREGEGKGVRGEFGEGRKEERGGRERWTEVLVFFQLQLV